jgi:hypothetical protein
VLRIYSIATGQLLHSWSTTDTAVFWPFIGSAGHPGFLPLSWVDGDRAVAFQAQASPPAGTQGKEGPFTARLLDVTAPSGDLIADSRVIWSGPAAGQATGAGCGQETSVLVTPDAKTLVCPGVSFVTLGGTGNNTRERITFRWLAYSLETKRTSTLYQATVETPTLEGASIAVLWASPSGDTVIDGKSFVCGGYGTSAAQLPTPLCVQGTAWNTVAFAGFSLATGQRTFLSGYRTTCQGLAVVAYAVWVNATGSKVIGWMHVANSIPGKFGVFSNGSFRPLPIPVPGNWYQWDDGSLLYQVAW